MEALCHQCPNNIYCTTPCPAVRKVLPARNPSQKNKTYAVDYHFINDTKENLNDFQREIVSQQVQMSRHEQNLVWIRRFAHEAISEALTPKEQRVIHDLFLEGLTQKEAAQRQGLSQATISLTKKRALSKLRGFLTQADSN